MSNITTETNQFECKEKRPGAADYSPKHSFVLKSNPRFAEKREARFREFNRILSEELQRPHSYESQDRKGFSHTNTGSFNGAKRFDYQGQGVTSRTYTAINPRIPSSNQRTTIDDRYNNVPRVSPDFASKQAMYSIIDTQEKKQFQTFIESPSRNITTNLTVNTEQKRQNVRSTSPSVTPKAGAKFSF